MALNISLPGGEFITTTSVVHCSGRAGQCTIFLNNGDSHMVNETMDSMEEKLPGHQFIRLHPSQIVNIDFINRYVAGTRAHVIMHDGTRIAVSPARQRQHDKLLNSL